MSISSELKRLVSELESVSTDHDEIFDTDVREELATAIYCGFIAPEDDFQIPDSFEMFSPGGDAIVKQAVDSFIQRAGQIASSLGWTEQQRQAAFQDISVTSEGGLTYDEFFGHAD